jgi:hypothetical protein
MGNSLANQRARSHDWPTLISIIAIATIGSRVIASLFQEAACWWVDCPDVIWDDAGLARIRATLILNLDRFRFLCASGTVGNLVGAAVAYAVSRDSRNHPTNWRLFYWAFATLNVMAAGMGMLIGSLLGVGEWAWFFADLEPAIAWRAAGIVAAFVVLAMGLVASSKHAEIFRGRGANRTDLSFRLSAYAYAASALSYVVFSVVRFGPPTSILTMFVGTVTIPLGILLLPKIDRLPIARTPHQPYVAARDWRWIAAAVTCFALAAVLFKLL